MATQTLIPTPSALADEPAGEETDARVALTIAALGNEEAALRAVIESQVASEPTPDRVIRERWMFLAVAWLYQHREEYNYPLAVIDEIWEAFGHAETLNQLIRWMPAPPGEPTGEKAMMERWRDYVETSSLRWAHIDPST